MKIPLVNKAGENTGWTIIDDIDGDLSDYKWGNRQGYAGRSFRHGGRGAWLENIFVHRVVLERKIGRRLRKEEVTDHINGDRLDNRRENLRAVTARANAQNRCVTRAKSGYRNVTQLPNGKFLAMLTFGGKPEYIGCFKSAQVAADAARQRREELGFASSGPRDAETLTFCGEFI